MPIFPQKIMSDFLEPEIAGMDIAVGWAVDSFLFPPKSGNFDPWREKITADFIDLVINHKSTVFPSPSPKSIKMLDLKDSDSYLPKIYSKDIGLIKPYIGRTAKDIPLSEEKLIKEFDVFKIWINNLENYKKLNIWLKYHLTEERLLKRKLAVIPTYEVNDFLQSESRLDLAKELNITEEYLIYSFDIWIRSIKYYEIFGNEIAYFPHEYRSNAVIHNFDFSSRLNWDLQTPQNYEWSWGQYFITLMSKNKDVNKIDLLNNISLIHEETLKRKTILAKIENPKEKIDIITSIAAELNLPANIRSEIFEKVKIAYRNASTMATMASLTLPPSLQLNLVRFIVLGGNIPLDWWDGKIPGKLAKVPFFKGVVEWKNLVKRSGSS